MDIKESLRRRIWSLMERENVALFPRPVYGRIPNFKGAERASVRVTRERCWESAGVLLIAPDSPQRPLRRLALEGGKKVLMPTPRLKEGFLLLDPRYLNVKVIFEAATIRGAFKWGKRVQLRELPPVDLIVLGSVVVDRYGTRIGKGGGYAELEYAILRELRLVDEDVPVITTVHDVQVVNAELPREPHDLGLDYIFTPTRVLKTLRPLPKPKGIYWHLLGEEKFKEIPLLRDLKKIG